MILIKTILENIPNQHLAISVLTLGEIRKGIELITEVTKKAKLIKWLEIDLVHWFGHNSLSINEQVADKWGYLMAQDRLMPTIDGLIAATALTYSLKLVTRNIKDFSQIPGLELINPWEY